MKSEVLTMPVTMQSLGIDRLSVEERLSLVHEIWDSIRGSQPPSMLTESQRAELRRRIAEDDSLPDDTVSMEEAMASALSRIPK